MINTGSIYLVSKDFEKSVQFYKLLLERDVTAQNLNRFAIFNVDGLCLSIMNAFFDSENPDKVITKGEFYDEYDNYPEMLKKSGAGKVVINLETDNLQQEHNRLTGLGLGYNMTRIRYINAGMPYYFFSLQDPDDNIIEITGPCDLLIS